MSLPVFKRVVLFFRRIAFLVSFPVIADLAAGAGGSLAFSPTVETFFSQTLENWFVGYAVRA